MTQNLTKWEKEELLRIYKRNRADSRCTIVRELTNEANKLTEGLDRSIKKLKVELKTSESRKADILSKNKLINFEGSSAYACKISKLHIRLIDFDKYTDEGIQSLIKGEFEGKITE